MNLFRRKRKMNGKVILSASWYGQYRDPATGKLVRVNLGLRLKEAAMEKLRQITSRLEKESVGMRMPAAMEINLGKPIMEQIEDYARKLQGDSCSESHVYNSKTFLRIIFQDCGWKSARDANVDEFCQWRTKQADKANKTIKKPKSPKTLHEYQTTLKAFFGWLKNMRRIDHNPFADLENVRRDGRKARVRRPLTREEFQRLLDVAGKYRLAYFVVGNTGMRRGDAMALTWADLNLDAAKPTWRSRAEIAKNHEGTLLPLHPSVRDALLQARPATWKPSDKVFDKDTVPSMEMHRKCLKLAGIEYKTDDGQFDFHALRMMFCSNLNTNEISLVYAAQFMRHKDVRQTASTYNDPHQMRLGDKIAELPVFGDLGQGTLKRTQAIGFHGQVPTCMDNNGQNGNQAELADSQEHEPELSATGTDGPLFENGCPTWIRTKTSRVRVCFPPWLILTCIENNTAF